jgi:hypothetical protein
VHIAARDVDRKSRFIRSSRRWAVEQRGRFRGRARSRFEIGDQLERGRPNPRTSAGFLEIARRRSRSGMARIDRSGHEPFTRSVRWQLLKMQRHVDTERLGGHQRDQGRSRVVGKCGETGISSIVYFVSN